MTTYQNKMGEAFLYSNYQSIEKYDLSNNFYEIILGPIHSDRGFSIEELDGKCEGTAEEFIGWLLLMIETEKFKVTWNDYIEYRRKVLPAMKEVDEKD